MRPFYFLKRALRNLRGAPIPAAVTAATIAVAVFLFGAFILLAGNFSRVIAGELGGDAELNIWVTQGTDPTPLGKALRELPGVTQVELISPEQGLAELAGTLGDFADVLDGVEANEVLPALFVVLLDSESRNPDIVRDLVASIRPLEGVASVDSGLLWLERFAALSNIALWAGIVWGVLLAIGSFLMVGNAARLAALTRHEEIEVLHLVGASDRFIVMPFFWEGLIQGALGSVLGVGFLYGGFILIERSLGSGELPVTQAIELLFVGRPVLLALALAGPVTGALGTFGAALRFVRAVRL